jgi:hypothetical protein
LQPELFSSGKRAENLLLKIKQFPDTPLTPHTELMHMPIGNMFLQGNIIHSANRAGAGLIAAAAFTVHRTNVSRGIFLPFSVLGLGGSTIMAVVGVMSSISAAGKKEQRKAEK